MASANRRPGPRLEDNPGIGYVAAAPRQEVWAAGAAYLRAGSERQMHTYLGQCLAASAAVLRMAAVRFDPLRFGLRGGEAYALDDDAYQRFHPLAQRAGLTVGRAALTLAPRAGVAFPGVRVERV